MKIFTDITSNSINLIGSILTIVGVIVWVQTGSIYGIGFSIFCLFAVLIREIWVREQKLNKLENIPIDFAIEETKPAYIQVLSFFGQVGSTGKIEIVIPSEIRNKTANPMTLVCAGTIETDVPFVENQNFRLLFGSTGQSTLKLQAGHIEPATLRMEAELNLNPAEQQLKKIANASYLNVTVTIRQNDGKSFQQVYKFPNPQTQLIKSFEENLASGYNSTGFKHVDGAKVLEQLKYLWKILP